ncbi:hypothetical protein PYCC9005_002692 [Savitreella phatthalungensis]
MSQTNTSVGENPPPTPANATMLQAFEWYTPGGGKHWSTLSRKVDELAGMGISAMWIPPACKASGQEGNGYDIYDLWDLGEFDQKGGRSTKWGPKSDLDELVRKARDANVLLYFDAVLNHKAGADTTQKCKVREVDNDDRNKFVSDVYEIDGWLGFDFPGRGDKYSKMKWGWQHFTGTDWDQRNERKAIFKIQGDGKTWADDVDGEKGSFDYLMFADIDHAHPEVADDIKKWGAWVSRECHLSGFRFDAVKHFSESFLQEFIDHVQRAHSKDHPDVSGGEDGPSKDLFCVGEFWKDSLEDMIAYLDKMNRKFSLFDAPLVYNFGEISSTERGDLRKVFDGSLVQREPVNACTLVTNHDTQNGQALAVPMGDWFKPLAYALILLRGEGYPCVFWGDLVGTAGPDEGKTGAVLEGKLGLLVRARQEHAYGQQDDYFSEANALGWVRRGTHDFPRGLAVVISNAGPATINMDVGALHAGQKWVDILSRHGLYDNEERAVTIGDDGRADFTCPGVGIAVFVREDAEILKV